MFGRFKAGRAPRWGFRTGWDDFVRLLIEQLQGRGVTTDRAALETGMLPLPEHAAYDAFDPRPVAAQCRDAEPGAWPAIILRALDEAFGTPQPRAPVPAPPAPRKTRFLPPLRSSDLRVQLTNAQVGGMLGPGAAKRPIGDAFMMLVVDMPGSETSLSWDDLDALDLTRDAAFALGRKNALADVGQAIKTHSMAAPGLTCDIAICNGFYLSGAILEMRDLLPPGMPQIVVPLSWHHWMIFELQPDATRATLTAMRELTDKLADGITTIASAAAWVTRSLWWWPTGVTDPRVIDPAALPPDLAARLRS